MDFGHVILDGLRILFYFTLAVGTVVGAAAAVMFNELRKLGDPVYLKTVGVIVRDPRSFDAVAEVIGQYLGANIYSFVTFKGMRYDFDRIAPASYQSEVGERELLLMPGLLYITRD